LAALGSVLAALSGVTVGASAFGEITVPRVAQVFVVKLSSHHVQQLTIGSVSHSGVQWVSSGRAVADVASGTSATWIERDTLAGARTRLSPRMRLADTVLSFSASSRLTGVGAVDENTNVNTIEVVGRRSRPRALDRFFQNPGPQAPVWSPNGRLIAYARPFGRVRLMGGTPSAGPQHIVVMSSDGRNRRVLTHGSGSDSPPVFSPDGRSLLFYRAYGSRSGLYIVPTRGGKARRIADGDALDQLAWSPNGLRIAYTGWRNGRGAPYLFLVDVRTGHVKRLAGSVQLVTPAWSPDSSKIAFATWRTVGVPTPNDGYAAVETIDADGRGRHAIVRVPGSDTLDLAWSPTGKQIAFTIAPQPPGD
jgi:Tol biopolymer transport system component